jgi:hypothetical protein
MKQIEDETVVDGEVRGDNLYLQQRNGVEINAGNVRGPVGAGSDASLPSTDAGNDVTQGTDGKILFDHDKAYRGNVTVFATAADRDSAIPSPVEGVACYLSGTHQLEIFNAVNGWAPPWNMPWGLAGWAKLATPMAGITSEVAVLSCQFKAVAGRAYEVHAVAPFIVGLTAGVPQFRIVIDGSIVAAGWVEHVLGAQWATASMSTVVQGLTTGLHHAVITGLMTPGGAVLSVNDSFNGGTYIMVNDAGPSVTAGLIGESQPSPGGDIDYTPPAEAKT